MLSGTIYILLMALSINAIGTQIRHLSSMDADSAVQSYNSDVPLDTSGSRVNYALAAKSSEYYHNSGSQSEANSSPLEDKFKLSRGSAEDSPTATPSLLAEAVTTNVVAGQVQEAVWLEVICVTGAMMFMNQLPLEWVAKFSIVGVLANLTTLGVVAASPWVLHQDSSFYTGSWWPRYIEEISREEYIANRDAFAEGVWSELYPEWALENNQSGTKDPAGTSSTGIVSEQEDSATESATKTPMAKPEGVESYPTNSSITMFPSGDGPIFYEVFNVKGVFMCLGVYLAAMSKIFFGYNFTLVVPGVQNSMQNPKKMQTAIPVAMMIVCVIYVIVSVASIWAVGEGNLLAGSNLYEALKNVAAPDAISGNPAPRNTVMCAGILQVILAFSILVSIMISYPLCLSGTLQDFEGMIEKRWFPSAKGVDNDVAVLAVANQSITVNMDKSDCKNNANNMGSIPRSTLTSAMLSEISPRPAAPVSSPVDTSNMPLHPLNLNFINNTGASAQQPLILNMADIRAPFDIHINNPLSSNLSNPMSPHDKCRQHLSCQTLTPDQSPVEFEFNDEYGVTFMSKESDIDGSFADSSDCEKEKARVISNNNDDIHSNDRSTTAGSTSETHAWSTIPVSVRDQGTQYSSRRSSACNGRLVTGQLQDLANHHSTVTASTSLPKADGPYSNTTSAEKPGARVPKWIRVLLRLFVVLVTFTIVACFGCKKDKLGPLMEFSGAVLIASVLWIFPLVAFQLLKRKTIAGISARGSKWECFELCMHICFISLCVMCAVVTCRQAIPALMS